MIRLLDTAWPQGYNHVRLCESLHEITVSGSGDSLRNAESMVVVASPNGLLGSAVSHGMLFLLDRCLMPGRVKAGVAIV